MQDWPLSTMRIPLCDFGSYAAKYLELLGKEVCVIMLQSRRWWLQVRSDSSTLRGAVNAAGRSVPSYTRVRLLRSEVKVCNATSTSCVCLTEIGPVSSSVQLHLDAYSDLRHVSSSKTISLLSRVEETFCICSE